MVQPHVDETIAHQGTDLYAAKAGEVFECSPEGNLLKDGKPVELDEKFAEVCSKAVEGAPLPEEIVKELGLPSGACWGVPSGQYYGGMMGPAPVMGSQMIPNYGMYPMITPCRQCRWPRTQSCPCPRRRRLLLSKVRHYSISET